MDRIKKIKIKQQDGTMSDYYPIGVDANNVDIDYNNSTLEVTMKKTPRYYENVASMKLDDTLQEGDMAITLGYYTANDGGGAEYNIVNGEYTDDGGSYHEIINGLFAKLNPKENMHVLCFGAIDDNNTPSANSIKNALAYCSQHNIQHLYFGTNIYIIETPISIPSNIYLHGNFCTFKVADTLGNFYSLINCQQKTNIVIENFIFDSNYNRNNYDISIKPGLIIYLFGSENITINNNTFNTCGVWAITSEANQEHPMNKNIYITNNKFFPRVGKNSKTPDKSGFTVDTTQVYIHGDNYVISNNVFTSNYTDLQTAFEYHGINGICKNNKITGFRGGILIVPANIGTENNTNIIVSDNKISDVMNGVVLWESPFNPLNNIHIDNNIINLNINRFITEQWFPQESGGVTTLTVVPTRQLQDVRNISVFQNSIFYEPDFLRQLSDSDYNINYSGIKFFAPANFENININNNTIKNAPGIGIFMQTQSVNSVSWDAKNINISENLIINPGNNINIATTSYNPRSAIKIRHSDNVNNAIYVTNNKTIDLNNNCTVPYLLAGFNKNQYVNFDNCYISSDTISDNILVPYEYNIYFNEEAGEKTVTQDSYIYKDGKVIQMYNNFKFDTLDLTAGYALVIQLSNPSLVDAYFPILIENSTHKQNFIKLTKNSDIGNICCLNDTTGAIEFYTKNGVNTNMNFKINITYPYK